MLTAIVVVFLLGFLAIAFEHTLKVDKAATAILTGVLCWTLYAMASPWLLPVDSIPDWFNAYLSRGGGHVSEGQELVNEYLVEGQLYHSLGEIASILFFLLGAMTIVELVDAFEGFALITDRIKATKKIQLLWIVAWLTFFMSAVLDNLTTTIVMVSLIKKLIRHRDDRLMFAGMIVVAANAGGAWTVIGDVTTTMLWIKGKLSTFTVMYWLILPSITCLMIPLLILSAMVKGPLERPEQKKFGHHKNLRPFHQILFLSLGLAGLLFVPIFKSITHLPPFMGMMFSLSVLWIAAEFVKHDLDEGTRSSTNVLEILRRVDSASILFFLGILLAISTLGATGLLDTLAGKLDETVGNQEIIALLIGLISSVVDNVPLVAAGIEMYDMPMDDPFWLLLAYCAGTGGSCLIIGSAAGVAAMGLEHIDFMWYLRRISFLALLGYLSGAGVYFLQQYLFL